MVLPRIGWILLVAAFSAQQLRPVAGQSSDEMPRFSVPQYSPCADQSKSLKDLEKSFNKGRVPSADEVTGEWAAIGFVGHYVSLSCTGVKRANKFEWVMIANGYSVEIYMIGVSPHTNTFKPDGKRSLALAVDFDADDDADYRCRLTQRKTLACLIGTPPSEDGVEFKRVPIEENEISKASP